MNRRTHLKTIAGLTGAVFLGSSSKTFSSTAGGKQTNTQGEVMTVTGAISPSELGLTLPHEHVLSASGDSASRYPSYPENELMETTIPYLNQLKEMGVSTIIDSAAAYDGRHPEFLKKIAQETGMHIVTNTGYSGAQEGVFIPEHVENEDADQIAERWISEFYNSIDDTGVYPGFILLVLEHEPLIDVDRKLIEAAAKAHKETGLPVQVHTGDSIYAINETIAIFSDNGVNADALTWVHANRNTEFNTMMPVAEMGTYITLDDLNPDNAERFLNLIKLFKNDGLMNKVLLSHDGYAFRKDGTRKDYHFLVTDFKPRFLAFGFSEEDFIQVTETNPANAMTINKRQS